MRTTTILPLLAASFVQAVDPLVDVGYAKYRGFNDGDVTKWFGVRFAAPPTGDNRFREPQDPEPIADIVDARTQGPICPPQQPTDFTVSPDAPDRFTVDEDCLFLSVTAPTNAHNRPVLFWIQGGGFTSNSNANYNAKDLAADGDIVVVQINYRVGMYGFLQSEEVKKDGSLNNGIKDMIKALEWVNVHIAKFGGDPEQVVIDGISAGGSAVALLLAARGGALGNKLFAGGIVESGGWTTMRTLAQGQEQYDCLAQEKGCADDAPQGSLACLRALNASAIRTSKCWFGPHIDDDLFTGSLFDMYGGGRVARVPTIMGACANEGTKYSAPEDTNTTADANAYFLQNDPTLTPASLDIMDALYVDQPAPVFPGKGPKWRQTANAIADVGTHCIVRVLQNALAEAATAAAGGGAARTWTYKYAVRDPQDERDGYGAWHVVNAYAIFGPNNTDGDAPASYLAAGANLPAISLTRAYWTSFVKNRDPNADRLEGAPEWGQWTGWQGRERLVIETGKTRMERMSEAQALRCEATFEFSKALGAPRSGGDKTELDRPKADEALAAPDCGFDDGCKGVVKASRRGRRGFRA